MKKQKVISMVLVLFLLISCIGWHPIESKAVSCDETNIPVNDVYAPSNVQLNGNVHLGEEGEIVQISDDDQFFQYINKEQFYQGNHTVRLPQDEQLDTYVFLNSDGITVEYQNHQLKLTPQGEKCGATLYGNSVIYNNLFGSSIHLKYTPILSGVKEDIILSEYTGINSFTFLMETDGLVLCENDGEYYLANNDSGVPIFYLGKILVYDAIGRPVEGTLNVEVVAPGRQYKLQVAVDTAYLTDPLTVYPVTIDPTFTISDNKNGVGAIEDAPVFSGYPDTNCGAFPYNRAGNTGHSYGLGRTAMRLTKLLTSREYQNVSANQITKVELFMKDGSGNAGAIVNIHPLTSNYTWTESTVTWNNVGSFSNQVMEMILA